MTVELQARRAPSLLLALAAVVFFVVLKLGHGTTFFFDEWDFLLGRRGHSAATFFDAQNGNCSFVPIVLFKIVLKLAGTTHYWCFRLVLVGLHLTAVGLFWLVLRRRTSVVLASAAAGLLLVMGQSPDNLIWPAQFGFDLGCVGGLAAVLCVERAGEPRFAALAGAALTFSLFSASVGIAFWIFTAVLVAMTPERKRFAWVAVVPIVLYGLWALKYGDSQFHSTNIPLTPAFSETMAANAAGAVFGLTVDFGRPIIVGLAAALAVWTLRGGQLTRWVAAPLAAVVLLWILTGLARAGIEMPTATRYTYPGAILMLLIAAELAGPRLPSPRVGVLAVIIVALAGLSGYGALQQRAVQLRGYAQQVHMALGAVDVAQPYVTAESRPVPLQGQVLAGPLVEVEKQHGAIGDTQAQLAAEPEALRLQADQILLGYPLVSVAKLAISPFGKAPPVIGTSVVPTQPSPSGCLDATPAAGGGTLDVVVVPGQQLAVTSPTDVPVRLRRFADDFDQTPAALIPHPAGKLMTKLDAGPGHAWYVELLLSQPATVCLLS